MRQSKWALCTSLLLWAVFCLSVHAQTLPAPLAPCTLADIDKDDDGLIEICDLETLNAIRYQLDGSGYRSDAAADKITSGCSVREDCKGYELIRSLDFNDDASYRNLENKNIWTTGEGWQPIGNSLNPFSAVFEANGYTISNLRIHRDIDSAGLFSRTRNDAEINEISLLSIDIKGNFWVGGLVGFNEGKISQSSVVDGSLIAGGDVSGGLVGFNGDVISNSYAYVNLIGIGKVGGLVGDNDGSVINSYSVSSIESIADNVGGLIGRNNGMVANSYARSFVKGIDNNVGGLVGLNNGSIINSYAMGNMQEEYDVQGRYRVGGLVGNNQHSISNSYAVASVIGDGYAGGLIGFSHIDGTVASSYWDLTVSRVKQSAGGIFRTTEQLKSSTMPSDVPEQIYYNWSVRDWDFGTERLYPALKYAALPNMDNPTCAPLSELPNCGDLLAGQYAILSNLVLLDGLSLFPTFAPEVFNYRVELMDNISQLRLLPTARDSNADISIVVGKDFSSHIGSGTPSTIPLDASADGVLITVARQYKIDVVYPLKIKGAPAHNRVGEGDRIALKAARLSNLHTHAWAYNWVQLSGINLLSGVDVQGPVLEFEVPKDIVPQTADSTDVVLQLQVSDGATTDTQQTTMTVVKVDNGSSLVQLSVPAFVDETLELIAPKVNKADLMTDADGIDIVNVSGYQWQSRSSAANAVWHDVKDAIEDSYSMLLSSSVPNHTRYRVQVHYIDGQGYPNSVFSEEVIVPVIDIDQDDDGLIEIHYLEDLAAIRDSLDGRGVYMKVNGATEFVTRGCPASRCIGYELVRDLDFGDDGSYRDQGNKSRWFKNGHWQLIAESITGTGGAPFTAIFEGNNRTISNFKIHNPGIYFVSLFGFTRGKIMNLGLVDVDVAGQNFIGGLAGLNEGVVVNCYVTGSVRTVIADSLYNNNIIVGGLVGVNGTFIKKAGLIMNSYANVNVKGGTILGGLVGSNHNMVVNSYASGSVQGKAVLGGLVGGNLAMIINSYADTRVKGIQAEIGGLVGVSRQGSEIINSYARGNAAGNRSVGGLVGSLNGEIIHSYANATVSGDTMVGGLVGISHTNAQVIGSYWDRQASGAHYSMGGTSKTTVELQYSSADDSTTPTDVYYGWHNDDWDFGTREQYPVLKYAAGADQQNKACRHAEDTVSSLPICGAPLPDRQRGLARLIMLSDGSASLTPHFNRTVSDYDITIAGFNNRLKLIPISVNSDAAISISINEHLMDRGIKSGTTSSEISLHSGDVIRITVAIKAKAIDYYKLHVHHIPYADIDEDDDGLIEIRKLEDLNAIRYDLHGSSYKAGPKALAITIGCPEGGCKGYELISDLDFNDDASYRHIEHKAIWTQGEGWLPIGNEAEPFRGIFRGNKNNIYHLMINRPQVDDAGLFGVVGRDTEVDGVGILAMNIRGKLRVGALAAKNLYGTISNSHAHGIVIGEEGANAGIGGLVGFNKGIVSNSHVISHVMAKDSAIAAGGLVGWNLQGGSIYNSYAISRVEGSNDVGGLVGRNSQGAIAQSYAIAIATSSALELKGLVGYNDNGSIMASYWDATIAKTNIAQTGAIGLSTEDLKTPTASGNSESDVYFNWGANNWDFGTSDQYPIIKYNHPRCNNPMVPPCGIVFSNQNDIRLRSLVLSEGVGLVPSFDPLVFAYDVFVSADKHQLQLTPTAFAPVHISLRKDDAYIGDLISGSTSNAIVLNGENPTLLRLAVEGREVFAYRFNIYRLNAIVDDIDEDNNGLIEVSNLEELNEIRYQADGTGYRENAIAPKLTIGCPPSGCNGYELTRDLDFRDISSYRNKYSRDAANMHAWTEQQGWQPIANFNSVFNANGKIISNLMINRPDISDAALFADTGVNAEIKGIGLLNIDIRAYSRIGGLVGLNGGAISNSYATGSVTGSGAEMDSAGGLVGDNSGTIKYSYVVGKVSGNRTIGGLVGNNNGVISDSYVRGKVTASAEGGGLVGLNTGSITNSYAIPEVSKGSDNGGLIGKNKEGSISNSYWNAETSGRQHSAGGTSKTTVQLQSPTAPGSLLGEAYFLWSRQNWDFGTVAQYPILRYRDDSCGSSQASSACGTLLSNQRFGLSGLELSGGARLLPTFHSEVFSYDITIDSNQDGFSVMPAASNSEDEITISIDGGAVRLIASGAKSRPIPAASSRIAIKVKDGGGRVVLYTIKVHQLSFIAIDLDKDDDGLIEISDLEGLNAIRYQLDGSSYRENREMPAITEGCPDDGCIGYELTRDLDFNDDASYRFITHKTAWTQNEGWLPIGSEQNPFSGVFKGNNHTLSSLMIYKPDLSNAGLFGSIGSDGRVEGLGLLNTKIMGRDKTGGLAGSSSGVIANSYIIGSVKGQGDKIGGLVGSNLITGVIVNSYTNVRVSGIHYIGGLVGFNAGRVSNNYAIGDVKGEGHDIGGFVGRNAMGLVADNYATSRALGNSNVGGFIGRNENNGELSRNYAVGSVIGRNKIGGFIAVNTRDSTLSNNYWDTQTSGITTGIDGSTAYSTKDLQTPTTASETIYTGWHTDVWEFGTSKQYPRLKYATGVDIADIFVEHPACGDDAGIQCGDLVVDQNAGLLSLETTPQEFSLLPTFARAVLDYKISVFSDAKQIQFIPTAYDANADIQIVSDAIFDETVLSANTSSAIRLHADRPTRIAISVVPNDGREFIYSIEVNRLSEATTDSVVDRDGDGLIEIDYLEDLHAIRYQPDGSGYRASSTAHKISDGCPNDGCKGYELSRDLDCNDNASYKHAANKDAWILGEGWLPIGSQQHPFTARFEGNGKVLSNLIINRPDNDSVGLFGVVGVGGKIGNIALSDAKIIGNSKVGGLVGIGRGEIVNSYIEGAVSGNGNKVGGLVGANEGIIENSWVDGTISGDREIGGLVGHNSASAKIIASFANGQLKGKMHVGGLVGTNLNQIINSYAVNDVIGHSIVGGLVGTNDGEQVIARGLIINNYAINIVTGDAFVGGLVGRNEHSASIINSYADSQVFSSNHSVGGLVGFNAGEISNAYAAGSVLGSRAVGGLAGYSEGPINNSYASVLIGGNNRVGGLVGSGDGSLVINSYWDLDVSGVEYSIGGIAFDTQHLQSPVVPSVVASAPYYQWRTEDWHFGDARQYPMLRYAAGDGNVGCGDSVKASPCGSLLLPYGLSGLEILEGAKFSPPFEFSHFSYRVVVNRGGSRIHLRPTAFASDSIITMTANNRLHANVQSGDSSLPILLNQSGTTLIIVEIDNIAYQLEVGYPPVVDIGKDIDDDDDGLIEIHYLEDLNAIRYQTNGQAYREDNQATRVTTGCAVEGCRGYELVRDLDFNLDASYRNPIINKPAWTTQRGWIPIASLGAAIFNAVLKGNGYSISNLTIDKSGFNDIALLGIIGDKAEIDGIGLLNCNVNGASYVGGLVGWNRGGRISNSYVSGRVSANEHVGGLVGLNEGVISNSYAAGQVISRDYNAGGLAGRNLGRIINSYAMNDIAANSAAGGLVGLNTGTILHSYAIGSVQSNNNILVGGLVGQSHAGGIASSYWDIETSGIEIGDYGTGFSSEMLKSSLVGTTSTAAYHGWRDSDWDFGTSEQYPALKYTYDRDTLLPHQRDGLYSLTASDEVNLFPPFNTHIFNYHATVPLGAEQMQLQATAINADASIRIVSGDLSHEQLTPASATVPLAKTSATHIIITVTASAHRPVSYRVAVHHLSSVEISGMPHRAVDEGQRVKLDGSHRLDKDSFSYLWTQLSGPPLLEGVDVHQALLDFTVPTNWVARARDFSEVVLRLEITADTVSHSKDVSLVINKRNNSIVPNRFAMPELQNTELSVPIDLSLDSDGGGEPETIIYQWQILAPTQGAYWRDISGATAMTYEIPARVIDATQYRVLISYVDKQGYAHEDIASKAYTVVDIDKDGDGLIEIGDAEGLSAIHYVLDGSGYKRGTTATMSTVGCPSSGCIGYELVKDISLRGMHWQPIGTNLEPFVSMFKGNNRTISNLFINRTDYDAVGLFGGISSTARIDGVALINVNVSGRKDVGSLAGINGGVIVNSYAEGGAVSGSQRGVGGLVGLNYGFRNSVGMIVNSYAEVQVHAKNRRDNSAYGGGLVGENREGVIINSYARGKVVGYCGVGGLVGYNRGALAKISNSYAVGSEIRFDHTLECGEDGLEDSGDSIFAGGLVGTNDRAVVENSYAIGYVLGDASGSLGGLAGISHTEGSIKNSYWDVTISGIEASAGGTSKTTVQLQSPTISGSTPSMVYYGWREDDWDFGSSKQYPLLKYSRIGQACGPLELPNCALLLSGQSQTSGLRQLILAGEAALFPAFHPRTFNYRAAVADVDAVELIPISENISAKSRISKNGKLIKEALSGERVSISLERTTGTLITIDLTASDERPMRYVLRVNRAPEIVLSSNLIDNKIDEGTRVRLDGSGSRDMDAERLSYRWTQVSGAPLLSDTSEKTDAILDLVVPEDLVSRTDTSNEVVLRLSVSDGIAIASEDISIRVKKINNGSILASAPKFIKAFEVSAPELDLLQDPDGVNDNGDIAYQWQEKTAMAWRDIPNEIYKNYRLDQSTAINTQYRVQLNYTDGQGYRSTTFSKMISFNMDIDRDDDGLIEIGSIEELNAMRYVLNGTAYKESASVEPISKGCPMSQCKGYELIRNLDFADNLSYRNSEAGKKIWLEGEGWQPIGSIENLFAAIFDGNGYTISNLIIKSADSNVGFFGVTGDGAKIDNIGLLNVGISGSDNVGALIGNSVRTTISNSFVDGSVFGSNKVGGLVGFKIGGAISNSYARGDVEGNHSIGGLVGANYGGNIMNSYARSDVSGSDSVGALAGFVNNGMLSNSYTTGRVRSDSNMGGLIGLSAKTAPDTVVNSYWNVDENESQHSSYGAALTTKQLQSPTAPGTTATAAYYNWSTNDWDFGNEFQYPALKDTNGELLLKQRSGLLSLVLTQPSKLSPNFDSKIFNYDLTVAANIASLRLLPTAANADIRVAGVKVESGRFSPSIFLPATTATLIPIDVTARDGTRFQYTLNVNNHFPQATVAVMPQGEIDEGEDVILDVSAFDLNDDKLIYQWSQNSDWAIPLSSGMLTGVIEDQNDADLSFKIPENLLAATQAEGKMEWRLTIEDGKAIVSENVLLRIIKKNNGTIQKLPSPTRRDSSYIAPALNPFLLQDPDGIIHANTVRYQWQKYERMNWVNIVHATYKSYAPQAAEIDQPYRVLIHYMDNQGHQDAVASDNTIFASSENISLRIYIDLKVFLEGALPKD